MGRGEGMKVGGSEVVGGGKVRSVSIHKTKPDGSLPTVTDVL